VKRLEVHEVYSDLPHHERQYARLCSAEDYAGATKSPYYRTLEDMCRLLRRVQRSQWWQTGVGCWFNSWPYNMWEKSTELQVTGRPRTRGHGQPAEAGFDVVTGKLTLWMPRWSWRRDFVLHEVAHFVTPNRLDEHGPLYARNRLEAQYLFAGERSGEKLEDAFRLYGVKIARGASRGWKEEMK